MPFDAEASTDTKIARLEGKMDLVLAAVQSNKDETRDSRRAVIANQWLFGALLGAVIVILGVFVMVAPVKPLVATIRAYLHAT